MQFSSFALIFAATAAAQPLMNVLAANNNTLGTLNKLLSTVPDITKALAGTKDITILAPSNDAFAKLLASDPGMAAAVGNASIVGPLLEYHVLKGMLMASAITASPQFVSTLLGPPFSSVSGTQKVEIVKVGTEAVALSGFKQKSTVTKPDIMFDGGVIHIVDTVLTVPATASTTAIDTGLTSLAGALLKANLVSGLEATKDITVFAPSNAAFEAVGAVVSGATNELLSETLAYHVIGNMTMFSTELSMMAGRSGGTLMVPTLQGGMVTIRSQGGQLFVNSARIQIPDVLISNGVVHVIDNVLNPLATTAMPDTAKATQAPAFAGASSQSQAPFTPGITPTTTLVPATMGAGAACAALPTLALVGAAGAAALFANM